MSGVKSEFSRTLRCERATTTTTATNDNEYSDKVMLPASFLSALLGTLKLEQEGLPSPLIFRLRTQGRPQSDSLNGGAVYCGVREFSGSEGTVSVPGWLLEAAHAEEGDTLVVEYVRLEKGQFAQLRVSENNDYLDLRSVLEAHMRRRMTALFVGETIRVRVGGHPEPIVFSVLALEPADAVDAVDTDLSVDIVRDTAAGQLQQLGSQGIDELLPGVSRMISAKAGRGTSVVRLHVPAQAALLRVALECHEGDASLCASRLVRSVGVLDNDWCDLSAPSQRRKQLLIEPGQVAANTDIYVSVVAFTAECQATLTAEFCLSASDGAARSSSVDSLTDDSLQDGLAECSNCGARVPEPRLAMHRIVCERHNVKCNYCSRIFKRNSAELTDHWHCGLCEASGVLSDEPKHTAFFHTPAECTCGSAQESLAELAKHRRTNCAERLIECRYCHTHEPQGELSTAAQDRLEGLRTHEAYCGSRSIVCAQCKAYVAIRQVSVHMRLHEARERERRANMKPCTNKECTRERNPGNDLGLCAACFGPFYTGQYDPTREKLLRRLARSLHTQLTRGCGHESCRNPQCATAAGALSQTTAAAKMVPVLKAYAALASPSVAGRIAYDSIDLHLCVN
ncbi:hypothetical protein GGF37_000609 [Kickxella alabastrina]|nr:hypothetical protein GGF37_000609 [Kickxella alabastrina]